jgi:ribonuclease HII
MYAGIDEVGVSSVAGPMVAAVVVLPKNHGISELPVDSKKISNKKIYDLSKKVKEKAIYFKIVSIDNAKIDKKGVINTQYTLWQKCAKAVRKKHPKIHIVIDGRHKIPNVKNQSAIVSADDTHDNVSAAAIIAKTWCDEQMIKYGETYPEYNFPQHKGYPTKEHVEKIREIGMCDIHRKVLAEKALNKKKTEQLFLSVNELKIIFQEIVPIIKENPKVLSEWELGFLRDQYVNIVRQSRLPTPRVQYFIQKTRNNIYKSINKQLDQKAHDTLHALRKQFLSTAKKNLCMQDAQNKDTKVSKIYVNCYDGFANYLIRKHKEIDDFTKTNREHKKNLTNEYIKTIENSNFNKNYIDININALSLLS